MLCCAYYILPLYYNYVEYPLFISAVACFLSENLDFSNKKWLQERSKACYEKVMTDKLVKFLI